MKQSRYNIWVEGGDSFYVFNGVSGALRRVSLDDYEALQVFLASDPEREVACSPALLAELVQGRMLVSDGCDELEILSKRYESSRWNTKHLGLTLVTSLGCNFDCPYCFEAKHPSIMDAEVQTALLQLVDDKLPIISSFSVCWYGGEPLVGKQPLLALSDAFIERCDRAGVSYSASIITNGYLLDEKTCNQLRERRVRNVQVTLDGPPEVHNLMRPLRNGRGTFWSIVRNLHHAVRYFDVAVRINVDHHNVEQAEVLLSILAAEGLADKLRSVYLGQLVGVEDCGAAPSATYGHRCFTNFEFAQAEQEFVKIAARYGFATKRGLPGPSGTPCTAVRANELVVGSKGELYKCFESVGNPCEVIGNIRDYGDTNGRLQKWLKYDPFADAECRTCVALPGCMGGCAHHAFDPNQYSNRCDTFRHTYRERVARFVEESEPGSFDTVVSAAQGGVLTIEKAR
jgi:uncharacterized protein